MLPLMKPMDILAHAFFQELQLSKSTDDYEDVKLHLMAHEHLSQSQ